MTIQQNDRKSKSLTRTTAVNAAKSAAPPKAGIAAKRLKKGRSRGPLARAMCLVLSFAVIFSMIPFNPLDPFNPSASQVYAESTTVTTAEAFIKAVNDTATSEIKLGADIVIEYGMTTAAGAWNSKWATQNTLSTTEPYGINVGNKASAAPSNKTLTIDGQNQYALIFNWPHTIVSGGNFHFSNTSHVTNFTMKDLTWYGTSEVGCYFPATNLNDNVTINFYNVHYTGPGMGDIAIPTSHKPQVNYTNCDIRLSYRNANPITGIANADAGYGGSIPTSGSPAHGALWIDTHASEVTAANYVTFSGDNTIRKDDSPAHGGGVLGDIDPIFYIYWSGGSQIKVDQGASLIIQDEAGKTKPSSASGNYTTGLIGTFGSSYATPFVVGDGATFEYHQVGGGNGFVTDYYRLGSFTTGEGSNVVIDITADNTFTSNDVSSYPEYFVVDKLSIGKDAKFTYTADYAGSAAGTTNAMLAVNEFSIGEGAEVAILALNNTIAYSLINFQHPYLKTTTPTFTVNNPKSVLFYNSRPGDSTGQASYPFTYVMRGEAATLFNISANKAQTWVNTATTPASDLTMDVGASGSRPQLDGILMKSPSPAPTLSSVFKSLYKAALSGGALGSAANLGATLSSSSDSAIFKHAGVNTLKNVNILQLEGAFNSTPPKALDLKSYSVNDAASVNSAVPISETAYHKALSPQEGDQITESLPKSATVSSTNYALDQALTLAQNPAITSLTLATGSQNYVLKFTVTTGLWAVDHPEIKVYYAPDTRGPTAADTNPDGIPDYLQPLTPVAPTATGTIHYLHWDGASSSGDFNETSNDVTVIVSEPEDAAYHHTFPLSLTDNNQHYVFDRAKTQAALTVATDGTPSLAGSVLTLLATGTTGGMTFGAHILYYALDEHGPTDDHTPDGIPDYLQDYATVNTTYKLYNGTVGNPVVVAAAGGSLATLYGVYDVAGSYTAPASQTYNTGVGDESYVFDAVLTNREWATSSGLTPYTLTGTTVAFTYPDAATTPGALPLIYSLDKWTKGGASNGGSDSPNGVPDWMEPGSGTSWIDGDKFIVNYYRYFSPDSYWSDANTGYQSFYGWCATYNIFLGSGGSSLIWLDKKTGVLTPMYDVAASPAWAYDSQYDYIFDPYQTEADPSNLGSSGLFQTITRLPDGRYLFVLKDECHDQHLNLYFALDQKNIIGGDTHDPSPSSDSDPNQPNGFPDYLEYRSELNAYATTDGTTQGAYVKTLAVQSGLTFPDLLSGATVFTDISPWRVSFEHSAKNYLYIKDYGENPAASLALDGSPLTGVEIKVGATPAQKSEYILLYGEDAFGPGPDEGFPDGGGGGDGNITFDPGNTTPNDPANPEVITPPHNPDGIPDYLQYFIRVDEYLYDTQTDPPAVKYGVKYLAKLKAEQGAADRSYTAPTPVYQAGESAANGDDPYAYDKPKTTAALALLSDAPFAVAPTPAHGRLITWANNMNDNKILPLSYGIDEKYVDPTDPPNEPKDGEDGVPDYYIRQVVLRDYLRDGADGITEAAAATTNPDGYDNPQTIYGLLDSTGAYAVALDRYRDGSDASKNHLYDPVTTLAQSIGKGQQDYVTVSATHVYVTFTEDSAPYLETNLDSIPVASVVYALDHYTNGSGGPNNVPDWMEDPGSGGSTPSPFTVYYYEYNVGSGAYPDSASPPANAKYTDVWSGSNGHFNWFGATTGAYTIQTGELTASADYIFDPYATAADPDNANAYYSISEDGGEVLFFLKDDTNNQILKLYFAPDVENIIDGDPRYGGADPSDPDNPHAPNGVPDYLEYRAELNAYETPDGATQGAYIETLEVVSGLDFPSLQANDPVFSDISPWFASDSVTAGDTDYLYDAATNAAFAQGGGAVNPANSLTLDANDITVKIGSSKAHRSEYILLYGADAYGGTGDGDDDDDDGEFPDGDPGVDPGAPGDITPPNIPDGTPDYLQYFIRVDQYLYDDAAYTALAIKYGVAYLAKLKTDTDDRTYAAPSPVYQAGKSAANDDDPYAYDQPKTTAVLAVLAGLSGTPFTVNTAVGHGHEISWATTMNTDQILPVSYGLDQKNIKDGNPNYDPDGEDANPDTDPDNPERPNGYPDYLEYRISLNAYRTDDGTSLPVTADGGYIATLAVKSGLTYTLEFDGGTHSYAELGTGDAVFPDISGNLGAYPDFGGSIGHKYILTDADGKTYVYLENSGDLDSASPTNSLALSGTAVNIGASKVNQSEYAFVYALDAIGSGEFPDGNLDIDPDEDTPGDPANPDEITPPNIPDGIPDYLQYFIRVDHKLYDALTGAPTAIKYGVEYIAKLKENSYSADHSYTAPSPVYKAGESDDPYAYDQPKTTTGLTGTPFAISDSTNHGNMISWADDLNTNAILPVSYGIDVKKFDPPGGGDDPDEDPYEPEDGDDGLPDYYILKVTLRDYKIDANLLATEVSGTDRDLYGYLGSSTVHNVAADKYRSNTPADNYIYDYFMTNIYSESWVDVNTADPYTVTVNFTAPLLGQSVPIVRIAYALDASDGNGNAPNEIPDWQDEGGDPNDAPTPFDVYYYNYGGTSYPANSATKDTWTKNEDPHENPNFHWFSATRGVYTIDDTKLTDSTTYILDDYATNQDSNNSVAFAQLIPQSGGAAIVFKLYDNATYRTLNLYFAPDAGNIKDGDSQFDSSDPGADPTANPATPNGVPDYLEYRVELNAYRTDNGTSLPVTADGGYIATLAVDSGLTYTEKFDGGTKSYDDLATGDAVFSDIHGDLGVETNFGGSVGSKYILTSGGKTYVYLENSGDLDIANPVNSLTHAGNAINIGSDKKQASQYRLVYGLDAASSTDGDGYPDGDPKLNDPDDNDYDPDFDPEDPADITPPHDPDGIPDYLQYFIRVDQYLYDAIDDASPAVKYGVKYIAKLKTEDSGDYTAPSPVYQAGESDSIPTPDGGDPYAYDQPKTTATLANLSGAPFAISEPTNNGKVISWTSLSTNAILPVSYGIDKKDGSDGHLPDPDDEDNTGDPDEDLDDGADGLPDYYILKVTLRDYKIDADLNSAAVGSSDRYLYGYLGSPRAYTVNTGKYLDPTHPANNYLYDFFMTDAENEDYVAVTQSFPWALTVDFADDALLTALLAAPVVVPIVYALDASDGNGGEPNDKPDWQDEGAGEDPPSPFTVYYFTYNGSAYPTSSAVTDVWNAIDGLEYGNFHWLTGRIGVYTIDSGKAGGPNYIFDSYATGQDSDNVTAFHQIRQQSLTTIFFKLKGLTPTATYDHLHLYFAPDQKNITDGDDDYNPFDPDHDDPNTDPDRPNDIPDYLEFRVELNAYLTADGTAQGDFIKTLVVAKTDVDAGLTYASLTANDTVFDDISAHLGSLNHGGAAYAYAPDSGAADPLNSLKRVLNAIQIGSDKKQRSEYYLLYGLDAFGPSPDPNHPDAGYPDDGDPNLDPREPGFDPNNDDPTDPHNPNIVTPPSIPDGVPDYLQYFIRVDQQLYDALTSAPVQIKYGVKYLAQLKTNLTGSYTVPTPVHKASTITPNYAYEKAKTTSVLAAAASPAPSVFAVSGANAIAWTLNNAADADVNYILPVAYGLVASGGGGGGNDDPPSGGGGGTTTPADDDDDDDDDGDDTGGNGDTNDDDDDDGDGDDGNGNNDGDDDDKDGNNNDDGNNDGDDDDGDDDDGINDDDLIDGGVPGVVPPALPPSDGDGGGKLLPRDDGSYLIVRDGAVVGQLVPTDDGFDYLDEDGVPLGAWTWDDEDEEWIFTPYPPGGGYPADNGPLSQLPKTGGDSPSAWYWLLLGAALAALAALTRRTARSRG